MKLLVTILTLLLLGYAAICAYLWAQQDRILFVPRLATASEVETLAAAQGYEPWLNARGERIGWKSISGDPSPTGDQKTNVLLICHGNGGFALGEGYGQLREPPGAPINFQTYLLEYPGYGARPGEPSALAHTAAAIEATDTLSTDSTRRIFLLGQSLGSGVACATASARPDKVAGLILVTPYDTLASGAAAHYPWLPAALLLRHRLDSIKNLAAYHGPVAFLIAGRDGTIPPRLGQHLFDRYEGPKKLWIAPHAGHNDLDQILADWPEITTWLTSTKNFQNSVNSVKIPRAR